MIYFILDACDKLGMLMMDKYVDCWYMHKTEHDYASYVEQWWQKDLKDLVDKDFNHPCVIMYSTGNEVAETAQERGVRLQQSFTDYLHKLDPTRPVTCGINIFFNFLSSAGFGVYSDEKAKKQAEAATKAAQDAQKKKPKKKAVRLVHGDCDITVPCLHSERLAAELTQKLGNGAASYHLIPGMGHASDPLYSDELLGQLKDYLDQRLG